MNNYAGFNAFPQAPMMASGFAMADQYMLQQIKAYFGLRSDTKSLTKVQTYFRNTEMRDPYVDELRLIDNIIFSTELLYGMEDILYNNIPKSNLVSESKMRNFANIISDIVEAGGEFSHTVRVGLMNQLLANILPEFELMPRIKTNNTTLQSVLNYCTKNFSNDLTLDILAEDLHISKFHISHLLNQKLGISFSAYLNNIRVHRACFLLNNSQNKISDISEDVGFGSIRSFNRAFKSVMNMTPLEYRNKI